MSYVVTGCRPVMKMYVALLVLFEPKFCKTISLGSTGASGMCAQYTDPSRFKAMEMLTEVLVIFVDTCVMFGASCRCLNEKDKSRMAAACKFGAPAQPRVSHGDNAYLGAV